MLECPPELEGSLGGAARYAGAEIAKAPICDATRRSVELRPVAFVVPERVYAEHIRELDALAHGVGARVIVIERAGDDIHLEAQIRAAVQARLELAGVPSGRRR